jgi:hypothetical protein
MEIPASPAPGSVPQPETNLKPPKPPNKRLVILVGVLLLVAIGAGAWYMMSTRSNLVSAPTIVQNPTPAPSPTESPVPTAISFEQTPKGAEIHPKVSWHTPSETTLKISTIKEIQNKSTFYDVGTFQDGPYKGGHVYVAVITNECEDMGCPYDVVLRIADNPNGKKPYAIIEKNSGELNNYFFYSDYMQIPLDATKIIVDLNVRLSDLDMPKTITGPKARQVLTEVDYPNSNTTYNVFTPGSSKLIFTDSKLGSVYEGGRENGYIVRTADSNIATYQYIPDIFGNNDVPGITWSDKTNNTKSYTYQAVGGCGSRNFADLVDGEVKMTDIKSTGTTTNGDTVYELVNTNDKMLKDIYNLDYNPYDYQNNKPATKISYAQFVKQHPVFFWVDPFGRLMRFTKNEFLPMAECAKPVIYLYPTKTQSVSIKLNPTGGFTYTEPDYAKGWNVMASPNGQLTTSDGENYPYLFWEGRSKDIYETPAQGFVVAKADVHTFLNEKLAKLGLNAQETADFEEYWQPYMQESSYYFVTFMGNQVMDKIAPLKINPKPDTVIRVLMDFKPLDKPVSVQGYEIKTPERKGFTVVEWGGVKN